MDPEANAKALLTPILTLLLALAALALGACTDATVPTDGERSFTILAVNDVYRIEGVDGGVDGGLARVRALRAELEAGQPDLLFLHAGDAIFPSLLSRQYEGAQMIDVLGYLDGDAEAFDDRMFFVPGNHEFDKDKMKDAALLQSRIDESQFTWFDTNLTWATGEAGRPAIAAENLLGSKILESGGVKVGLFGLVTDFKDPAYVAAFGDLESTARETTAELRAAGAEIVVALTHLKIDRDKALLENLGDAGPDLVVGGHEHNKLEANVAGRWVLKADAEARTATVIRVTVKEGAAPEVSHEYRRLDAGAAKDGAVDERVAYWLDRLDKEYCASLEMETGCLEEKVGSTRVRLVGEELRIRRFETNYGDWILDQARQATAEKGVQIAFVNAGSLRLNQDIPEGDVQLLHVEETFQYPTGLVALRIPGRVLQQVIDHAVTDWTGNGKWLQISGFAFRHDPATSTADRLTLLTPDGPRSVDPDEEVLALVSDYLADSSSGQDGYTMLVPEMRLDLGEIPTLRELVLQGLEEAGEQGIAPQVEGRICNTTEEGPCLAVGDPVPG